MTTNGLGEERRIHVFGFIENYGGLRRGYLRKINIFTKAIMNMRILIYM